MSVGLEIIKTEFLHCVQCSSLFISDLFSLLASLAN
jgi:hypothetical protein